jgi:hypothetical protein
MNNSIILKKRSIKDNNILTNGVGISVNLWVDKLCNVYSINIKVKIEKLMTDDIPDIVISREKEP